MRCELLPLSDLSEARLRFNEYYSTLEMEKQKNEYDTSRADVNRLFLLYEKECIAWPSSIARKRLSIKEPTQGDCREVQDNINFLEMNLKRERIKKLAEAAISRNVNEVDRLIKNGISVLMPHPDEPDFPDVFSYYLHYMKTIKLPMELIPVDISEHIFVFLKDNQWHVDFLMYTDAIKGYLCKSEFKAAQQVMENLNKEVLDKFRAHGKELPPLKNTKSLLLQLSNAETLLVAHQFWNFSEDELVNFTCRKIQSDQFSCALKILSEIKFNDCSLQKIKNSQENYWKNRIQNLRASIIHAQSSGNRSKELIPILNKIGASADEKDQKQLYDKLVYDLKKVATKIRKTLFGSSNFFGNGSRTATAIENIISELDHKTLNA